MKTKVVKIALLFISIASTLVAICLLDDVVPVHFNALGEVDRWGSKYELLVLPLVLFSVQLIELFTKKFLSKEAERSTDEKVKSDALSNMKVLDMTFVGVSAFFTAMNFVFLFLTFSSMNRVENIHIDVMKIITILMGLLFVFLGYVTPKSRINGMVGLRTSWTGYNDETWRKSNRFAGYAFIIFGIFTVIFGLAFDGIISLVATLCALFVVTIVVLVYSYRVYKTEIAKENN